MTIQDALKKANMGIKDEYEKIRVERAIDSQLKGFVPLYFDIATAQVASLSGTVYYVNPGSVTIEISEWEKRILEANKGSAVWFGTNPSSQTIRVGRAINSIINQELIGYEIIQIRESSIHDIYRRTDLFKSGDILITDLEGRIISHKDKSKLDMFIGDVAAGLTKDSIYNSFTTAEIGGTSNYIASRSINNGKWRMIAIIPTEQYEGDIILLRYWILGICGACCVMSLLLSVRIADSISRPLRNLSEMMSKVGKGNFDVSIEPYSNDEVGVLSEHFNKMVLQVQKLIQEVYQEQYLKQKAELKSLRAQINPHGRFPHWDHDTDPFHADPAVHGVQQDKAAEQLYFAHTALYCLRSANLYLHTRRFYGNFPERDRGSGSNRRLQHEGRILEDHIPAVEVFDCDHLHIQFRQRME